MAGHTDGAWVFAGHGEMARRCAEFDWSSTPLGPLTAWPQSLRTTTGLTLACGSPRVLLWGPDLVQIYNDGYIPVLGHRHPRGLGVPARECWPETWPRTAPIYTRVRNGETVTLADQRLQLRHGDDAPPEEVVVTVSHVPVRGEQGSVEGIFSISSTRSTTRARAMQSRSRRPRARKRRWPSWRRPSSCRP